MQNSRYNTPQTPYMLREEVTVAGMQSTLVRFLLMHLAFGGTGGIFLGALIIWQDFNNIGSMIMASPDMFLWMGMLFFGLFITFGSVAMGVAIMSMGEERDWPRGEGPDDR